MHTSTNAQLTSVTIWIQTRIRIHDPDRHQNLTICSLAHCQPSLIGRSRKYDHVSPLLQELHWLSVAERIKYRLAVLVFHCRHDMAPEYLASDLQWAANTESRQHLRSSSSQQLIVPKTRLFTVGDRAFGAAAARIWNSLPSTVTTAETLNSFKKHLKTHLFHCSFPSL